MASVICHTKPVLIIQMDYYKQKTNAPTPDKAEVGAFIVIYTIFWIFIIRDTFRLTEYLLSVNLPPLSIHIGITHFIYFSVHNNSSAIYPNRPGTDVLNLIDAVGYKENRRT